MSDVVAVIPARLASSRLPRKVLVDLGGRPMLWWAWDRCRQAGLDVWIATADAEVADVAEGFGATVVQTGSHPSGTDRVAEAARSLSARWVLGVQADEPLLDPSVLTALADTLRRTGADLVTPACPLLPVEHDDPHAVKCAWEPDGRASWFRRDRVGPGRHLGLYGWRSPALQRFARLPPHPEERRHRLEQLRALHSGFDIRVVPVPRQAPGVDTPADLEAVRRLIARNDGSCADGSAG